MSTNIKFKRNHPLAKLPTRGSAKAAGLDLYSVEEIILKAGERKTIKTGLAVAIPDGFYGRIAPRSGLAFNDGINVLGGVIDSDFRGEIHCILINHSQIPKVFRVGDRIAQLIIESIITPTPEWDDNLDQTMRNEKGIGSSGR